MKNPPLLITLSTLALLGCVEHAPNLVHTPTASPSTITASLKTAPLIVAHEGNLIGDFTATPSPLEEPATSPTKAPIATVLPTPTPELAALFYYTRAVQLLKVKEYDDAIATFGLVLRRLPDLAIAYRGRGAAYYYKDLYGRGLEDLNKAIMLDPNLGGAYYYRGLIYQAQGNPNEAITEFEKAISKYHPVREAYEKKQAVNELFKLRQRPQPIPPS